MCKLWLKNLTLNYDESVFDIVQFGSSTFESSEPNDIDVAVIFKNTSVKNQMESAQNIKEQLQSKVKIPIHVKSFDLYSFFDKGNFAKENILFNGFSLLNKNEFSLKFGLKPFVNINYDLNKFDKKTKIRFNYLLSGRQGKYGLLKKYGGKIIGPGILQIAPIHEKIFLEKINKFNLDYEVSHIFIQKII